VRSGKRCVHQGEQRDATTSILDQCHARRLPLALADLGLIDEYEFVVHPVLAGHGPTLLAGLRERIQLELVDRHEFRSGAVALRYRTTRPTA